MLVDETVYNTFPLARLQMIAQKVFQLSCYVNYKDFFQKKYLTNLRKHQLIYLLARVSAARKIQQTFRRRVRENFATNVCPLTLEPIGNEPYFVKQIQGSNHRMIYNLNALRDFLLVSGDFRDPITKESFTDLELIQMDKLAGVKNIATKASVYYAKYYAKKFYLQRKILEEQCEIYTDYIFHYWGTFEEFLGADDSLYKDPATAEFLDQDYFYPMLFKLYALTQKSKEAYAQTWKSLQHRITINLGKLPEGTLKRDYLLKKQDYLIDFNKMIHLLRTSKL